MIGLVADSHGNNRLLLDAVDLLEKNGASQIIHLGDICDSLDPGALETALPILESHGIKAVMGNNECSVLNDLSTLSDEASRFLEDLPFTLRIGDLMMAHSAPFDWPAATRRPIDEYLPFIAQGDVAPFFRILFRGHSHSPSVITIRNRQPSFSELQAGTELRLDNKLRYIVTVGAVEDLTCAAFDPLVNTLKILNLSNQP